MDRIPPLVGLPIPFGKDERRGGGGGGTRVGPVEDIAVLRVRTRCGGGRWRDGSEELSCAKVTEVNAVVLVGNADPFAALPTTSDDAHDT